MVVARVWRGFLAWGNRLDAGKPWPSLEEVGRVAELDSALAALPDATSTWEILSERDRVGLSLFVRSAWGRRARRRRATAVAIQCSGGVQSVRAWQVENRAFGAAWAMGSNGSRPTA